MGAHPRTKRILGMVLVTIVTLVILGLLLMKVRPGAVFEALASGNVAWILGAALVALGFNTLQSAEALRWCLAGFGQKISFSKALAATAGNMAIKAALPVQTGEVARVAWLERACGVDAVTSTAAIAALLWFKLIGLLALALTGWLLIENRDPTHGGALIAGTLLAVVLPVLVARLGRSEGRKGILRAVSQAMGKIRSGPLAIGAVHCVVAVVAEIAVFGMILHAAGGTFVASEVVGSLPLVIIGAKIPVTLLGLGTREGLVLLLMSGTNPESVLLAAALLFSTLEYVLPALVGGLLTYSYVRKIMAPRCR